MQRAGSLLVAEKLGEPNARILCKAVVFSRVARRLSQQQGCSCSRKRKG